MSLVLRSGVGPGATIPLMVTRGLYIGEAVEISIPRVERITMSPAERRFTATPELRRSTLSPTDRRDASS